MIPSTYDKKVRLSCGQMASVQYQ